ncbi:serine/threonine protein kinase [Minicystis rosea]|nr:serine/threonine protein kinase [Minicystis rosea]
MIALELSPPFSSRASRTEPCGAPASHVSEVPLSSRAAPFDYELLEPLELLSPGARLEGTPYIVVRLLGQGGMGEVYEVEHAALGRRAALKVLHRDHQDRPDLAARLRDEARSLARLRHPNLVEVFDLGMAEGGRPYFAMPLLRGRDLRTALACSGTFHPHAALALVAQALDGLAAAHAAGLVHRDVKLENLFLEDDGTLKVLDFGVAKVMRAGSFGLTQPGVSPGTPRTMAPEQCAGVTVDARADLYAIGLALHELVTGRGPFDELRDDRAIRFAHCDRTPLPPSRFAPQLIGPELDALILRALAKSPADRFQTAAEMAAAVRALLPAPRAPESSRPPPLIRPRAHRRRLRRPEKRWIPAVASALAVASFALGLAFGRTLPLLGAPDRGSPTVPATKL